MIAASSAAITSSCVESAGGTMPLPTVVATAVPVSAPTMLRTPAIKTAVPGFRTRVATEVAIAFAVSWKPLMKSKTSAMATIRMSTRKEPLGILHNDPFQRISYVLAAISGVLQVLVNLAPANGFNDARNIGDVIELFLECVIQHIVGLTLKPLQFDDALPHVFHCRRFSRCGTVSAIRFPWSRIIRASLRACSGG